MYETFGSYDYSVNRSDVDPSLRHASLYLDYNEYFGDIHPDTSEVYKRSAELLASYYRPGEVSLESRLSQTYGHSGLKFHLVSGADHALEEILGYLRRDLKLKSFHSYHQTTYDHFYTFAQKIGFESSTLNSAEVVYVCCPNNPDGSILSAVECARLITAQPGKVFVFDFSYLAYSVESYSEYVRILKGFPQVYIVSSLAKLFPIAGVRSGWLCTTDMDARLYFEKFLNAKMINPIARKILESCLLLQDFYLKQTTEIFSNRESLAALISGFLFKKGVSAKLKYDLNKSGGNFFSLQFEHNDDLKRAISSLEEVQIYIRHKAHWDFIRITSVNNQWLENIKARLQ